MHQDESSNWGIPSRCRAQVFTLSPHSVGRERWFGHESPCMGTGQRRSRITTMRALLLGAVALLLGLAGATAHEHSVLLIDARQGRYLNSVSEPVKLQNHGQLAALMGAVSGLMFPSQVDEEATKTIEQVVKPSPLKKPRAHMVFNVAGLSPETLAEVFGDRAVAQIQVEGSEGAADVAVGSLAALAAANPGVSLTMLDYKGLQGCSGNCIEEHMHAAAECVHAKHSDSTLVFKSGDSLDLSLLSDKVFAAEIASLYSGLKAHQEQISADAEDVHVLEATLVGVQALEATHGSDASVTGAARDAVKDMLQWTVMQLDSKYEGDITYQVTGLAPEPKKTVADIMGWKQEARRKLAEAEDPSEYTATARSSNYPGNVTEQAVSAKKFTEKACGYGSFVLLVYFSLAAVWCMCFMPFKQDTMLFGAKKMD